MVVTGRMVARGDSNSRPTPSVQGRSTAELRSHFRRGRYSVPAFLYTKVHSIAANSPARLTHVRSMCSDLHTRQPLMKTATELPLRRGYPGGRCGVEGHQHPEFAVN